MKFNTRRLLPLLAAVVLSAAFAPVSEAEPKPAFPAGTWTGKGTISGSSSEYGQETRTTGKARFTIKVSKGGRVTGSGKWVTTEVGSGAIASEIRSVAPVEFAGTAVRPTYSGTQTVTTSFSDGERDDGNSFTLPFSGALRIKRAGHCRVTGGQTVEGVALKWTALLEGSGTCNT